MIFKKKILNNNKLIIKTQKISEEEQNVLDTIIAQKVCTS